MAGRRDIIPLSMARRVALAAQGFARPRPTSEVTRRDFNRLVERLGLFQIDSVSAVVRAHYMPSFSRLGAYPRTLLDDAASRKPRRLFEYWAHEASFLPVETWSLMQWRMARAARGDGIYKGLAQFGRDRRDFIDEIFQEVKLRGPIAASDIEGHKGSGGWWGWSEAKRAFEWLFWAGRITTASRRGFERLYDLPERVLPKDILALSVPAEGDARSNMHVGGVAEHAELTAREKEICARIGPRLKEEGFIFVGIDVIGDWMTEINVTSPTGIREVKKFSGTDIAALIWDAIEKRK